MESNPIPAPTANTDREIWRRTPDDFYSDSVHVTQDGAIGINVGGKVIVHHAVEWHRMADELAMWKPMTPAEAQAAYDAAEALPMPDEEIQRIVKFATDPANSLTNQEEAQLHVAYKRLESALVTEREAREAAELELTNAKRFINSKDRPLVEALQMIEEQSEDLQAKLEAAERVCDDMASVVTDLPYRWCEKNLAAFRYLNRVKRGQSAELRLAAADAVDPNRTFAERDAAYCRVALLIGESGVVIPADEGVR